MLTFVRTTELRGATWEELDLDRGGWRIPAERMKMRGDYIVPLSRQAIAAFREHQHLNGQWKYMLPNSRKPIKQMSENAVHYALY